jgi:hypothetical protein
VWDKILKNITGDWQVVCACNPCYSGGGGGGEEEDCGPRPALGLRLYLKNKLKQKG